MTVYHVEIIYMQVYTILPMRVDLYIPGRTSNDSFPAVPARLQQPKCCECSLNAANLPLPLV